MGDSLFRLGEYQQAAIAYEYAIFKLQEPSALMQLVLKKAEALLQFNNFEEAYQTLERVNVYTLTDSMAATILYRSALAAQLANKPDICLSKLTERRVLTKNTEETMPLLLEILALNDMRRWEEARPKFLLFRERFAPHLNDPYANPKEYKMKNPDKASNLSYILPGVGQWYAGYFQRGFVSATINGGLVTLSVLSMLNGYYLSGAFTGVLLFYLFYNGGIRYAEVLANQYNEEKAKKFNSQLKALLIGAASQK